MEPDEHSPLTPASWRAFLAGIATVAIISAAMWALGVN